MDKVEQANSFLSIIRSLIKEEQRKQDRVEICQIDSVNEDGTVNIKMLSDFESVRIIPNISNQSVYDFKNNDLAIVYLIQNQLSNAFIIAKCGPTDESLRISSSPDGSETVIQNITYQTGGSGGVISVNGKTGNVVITAEDLGAITEIPAVTQIQSTDISSLIYDTTNGAAFEINSNIIFSDGTKDAPSLKFNLPIIGINGISIDKANGKNVLEISGKDLQDWINSISLTSGTNNGTLKLTVGSTVVDNIKVTGFDQKQDSLTQDQLNAVNSGITSEKVGIYDEYQSQIDTNYTDCMNAATNASNRAQDAQETADSKYTKPMGGIPKTDLSSGVQASLDKADSALQSHQKITTGSANGTIAVDGTDVSVKGLKALAYKDFLTKADVGLGSVVNAGQDSTPTAGSNNYVTSGGIKNYVDTAISNVTQFQYIVVDELPEPPSTTTMGKIYLVPHSHTSDDGYDEYITIETGDITKTYSWEKIGNTDIDLSNYVNDLSGIANNGVITNLTKSGNTLSVTSTDLSGTKTASDGKYISGITQDKTGKITSLSESDLPETAVIVESTDGKVSAADYARLSESDNSFIIYEGLIYRKCLSSNTTNQAVQFECIYNDYLKIDVFAAYAWTSSTSGTSTINVDDVSKLKVGMELNFYSANGDEISGAVNNGVRITAIDSTNKTITVSKKTFTSSDLPASADPKAYICYLSNDPSTKLGDAYVTEDNDGTGIINVSNWRSFLYSIPSNCVQVDFRTKSGGYLAGAAGRKVTSVDRINGTIKVSGAELDSESLPQGGGSYATIAIGSTYNSKVNINTIYLYQSGSSTTYTISKQTKKFGDEAVKPSSSTSATSGTFDSFALGQLNYQETNYIVFNKEYYRLVKQSSTFIPEGSSITFNYYGCVSTDDTQSLNKFFKVNMSTGAWTLSTLSLDLSGYYTKTESDDKFVPIMAPEGGYFVYAQTGTGKSNVTRLMYTPSMAMGTLISRDSNGRAQVNNADLSKTTGSDLMQIVNAQNIRQNTAMLQNATPISEGSDLNNYKTCGTYCCYGNSEISNLPRTGLFDFLLYVFTTRSDSSVVNQMLISTENEIYIRSEDDSNTFSGWVQVSTGLTKQTTLSEVVPNKSYELGDISSGFALSVNESRFKTVNDASQIYFKATADFTITLNTSDEAWAIGDGQVRKQINCKSGNAYYITIGYTPKGVSIVSSIDVSWNATIAGITG